METRKWTASGSFGPRSGFTLIELLIVIFIIAVLAGLATVAVGKAKGKMQEASARQTITAFETGLNQYYLDHNVYPAYGEDDDFDYAKNYFPELYEALLGEKPPDGRAGKNAPYVDKINAKEIVTYDDEDEEFPWVTATRDDLFDPDIEKYYLDPWGVPYHYRECDSKRSREPWMINRSKYDLWSYGPDETDQSVEGPPEDPDEYNDDIGNWNW